VLGAVIFIFHDYLGTGKLAPHIFTELSKDWLKGLRLKSLRIDRW